MINNTQEEGEELTLEEFDRISNEVQQFLYNEKVSFEDLMKISVNLVLNNCITMSLMSPEPEGAFKFHIKEYMNYFSRVTLTQGRQVLEQAIEERHNN